MAQAVIWIRSRIHQERKAKHRSAETEALIISTRLRDNQIDPQSWWKIYGKSNSTFKRRFTEKRQSLRAYVANLARDNRLGSWRLQESTRWSVKHAVCQIISRRYEKNNPGNQFGRGSHH